jgi:hypothetical protein
VSCELNNEDGDACKFNHYRHPEDLLREFCEYVVKPFCPGGISEAIMDLMRKAVEEQKRRKFAS